VVVCVGLIGLVHRLRCLWGLRGRLSGGLGEDFGQDSPRVFGFHSLPYVGLWVVWACRRGWWLLAPLRSSPTVDRSFYLGKGSLVASIAGTQPHPFSLIGLSGSETGSVSAGSVSFASSNRSSACLGITIRRAPRRTLGISPLVWGSCPPAYEAAVVDVPQFLTDVG